MDPIQTIIDIYEAINDSDVITANERYQDLREWINKGGFVPAALPDVERDLERLNIETEEMINDFVR